MRRLMVLFLAVLAFPATAQKVPKVDSLLVHLPSAKTVAMERVVEAFMLSGLTVTNQTASMVESDQESTDQSIGGIRFTRVVHALIVSRDSTSTIFITGEEVRLSKSDNRIFKRLRIDNKAGGEGGKIWTKMAAAAHALDPIAYP